MHVIGIIVIFSWKLIANVDPVIGSAYCNIAILLAFNNCHKVGTLGVGGRCFFFRFFQRLSIFLCGTEEKKKIILKRVELENITECFANGSTDILHNIQGIMLFS